MKEVLTEWLKENASKACKEWLDNGITIDDYKCQWVGSWEIEYEYSELWHLIEVYNTYNFVALHEMRGYVIAMNQMNIFKFDGLLEYIEFCAWCKQRCSLSEYDKVAYTYGHL